ncbi:MAG: 50S ribosomal protein L4 [Candidatus Binatia bacterium]|nr:50S ribosomal protein L4 [Candidatus Binatia bacterium]
MMDAVDLQAKVRGIDGSEQGDVTLPELFSEKVREHLIHEVVKMQQASRRAGTHSTKTRHFVSGGGAKPWRQKGTGNARAGSSRSPIWEGGAVTFGPLPRDYSYSMPVKARRVALKSVLADRLRGGNLTVVDSIELDEGKTKRVLGMLEALGIESNVLIVNGEANEFLERGARNLHKVKVLRTEGVNVYDVLRYKHLLLTKSAVEALKERLER